MKIRKELILGSLSQGAQCLRAPGFEASARELDAEYRHTFIPFSRGGKSLLKQGGKKQGGRISPFGTIWGRVRAQRCLLLLSSC